MKKKAVFSDILTTVTKYFLILVVSVIILICFSGVRIVESGNVALILRFGKLVGDTYDEQVNEPGLLLAFPYVIDEVIMVPTGSVMEQTVSTHYTSGNMTTLHNNGYLITGDQNVAVVSVSVKYIISDPVAYALIVKDISGIISSFVSSAMVECVSYISVDELLTSGKDKYCQEVLSLTQDLLSSTGTGITIGTIELTSVSMPNEGREIYDLVNSATVQAATQLEQAYQYRENIIPQAEAEASAFIALANTEFSGAVATAKSDLAEFWGTLEEYSSNPELVKIRIYNSKVSKAMSKIGKVRVVQDGETKIVIN